MITITVLSIQEGAKYVPVPIQTLVRILLSSGYAVNLIGENLNLIPDDIRDSSQYKGYELPIRKHDSVFSKLIHRYNLYRSVNYNVVECMRSSNYLWITSPSCIRILKKKIFQYKTIVELLELQKCGYSYRNLIKFDIGKYAKGSWKNVTVEQNRAYIQQIWWDLKKVPYVLPNKPFNLNFGELTSELESTIKKMKNEKRKIILYLGGIYSDRYFESIAKAISKQDDYVMYIVGRIPTNKDAKIVEKIVKNYSVEYLGYYLPPSHLALISYARIGILPYQPSKESFLSELNALYCAPNKIWEYAGFGVPMVGSDVLGLKLPFEQWNIGRCCDLNDESSIIKAIEEVDRNHDEMSLNCYKFYDSVDLEKIVSEILEDEN